MSTKGFEVVLIWLGSHHMAWAFRVPIIGSVLTFLKGLNGAKRGLQACNRERRNSNRAST